MRSKENILFQWDGAIVSWRYAGKTALDNSDSEEETDAESPPRTLRRSQRIAAQRAAKHSRAVAC